MPPFLQNELDAARQDPALAEQLAQSWASTEHLPIVDISEFVAGTGPVRYAATGEPVTPESEARYRKLGDELKANVGALYASEHANGTPAAQILEDIFGLINAQPEDFRTVLQLDR